MTGPVEASATVYAYRLLATVDFDDQHTE